MNGIADPMDLRSPTLHGTIWFTIAVFSAVIAISIFFTVEVVARGQGRVVPVNRVQVIQPEFYGRIDAIHVGNGASVERGDILIELDATDAKAELANTQSEQERLIIERARIEEIVKVISFAEQSGDLAEASANAKLQIQSEIADSAYTREQRELLAAEIADLFSALAQIEAQDEANLRAEAVTRASIDRTDAALAIQADRLATAEQLLGQGTTSRAAFLDVQQAFTDLEREREVNLRELDRRAADRGALAMERRRLLANQRSKHLERRTQIEARLATVQEEARALLRRVDAATLRAPVAGIVDQLSAFTIGGVAQTGAELLRIVPTNVEIELEGVFSNQDIGFMEIGQRANLRFDAYPSERFGFVQGAVNDIAADSTDAGNNNWGYIVRISPDTTYLSAGTNRFQLRPGMTATIDVQTEERRIITYFFAPIVRTIQDAMGER
ncbi:HlyD family type I secretion periplasmic adaptor subunit [Roseinatronobacter sp. S2]|uniref:HlyD family type I secretion periplasmic adaptor subunit n=1 Tax=Roseinatronobacter sp. S2 TaxID=3035471 RepID=UPI0024102F6E|nr:HlyD family type I secretion periplasmic adaptor subunit [Roseinatronobacter sp. S2]WFE75755.1 HlyD family type I secretion periplasmic adaptor subunit [Roseinatronobacter sp. S2]